MQKNSTRPASERPFAKVFKSEKRADQSARATTNINSIIANYRENQTSPVLNRRQPLYGDFTEPQDLQLCLDRVKAAQEAFQQLPANVRKAASNDPVEFLEMVNDPEGLEYLESLGLEVNEVVETPPEDLADGDAESAEGEESSPPKPARKARKPKPAAQPAAEASETPE